MKLIFSHPTGNANVRAAAYGLKDAELMSEFRTSIASFSGDFLDFIGSIGPLAEIKRRHYDSRLRFITRTWPWIEASRLIAQRAGFNSLIKHETGILSIDAVYRSLDKRVAKELRHSKKKGVQAVYAYEDGAQFSFREAKKLNLQCLYDLPIGYWRAAKRLLDGEQLKNPEWSSTLVGFQDSELKLARKDEELQLADRIFVASSFTASTLKDFPGTLAPIEVIPYGFPSVINSRDYLSVTKYRRLKILFVGGLSQRKGISYLFNAVEALKEHVELTIVGYKASHNCPALDAALAKHRWIPSLPHAEVLKLMQASDVLIFPSLFEGFGLVITEAMSQGTPVITTDRTAGPDLIEHSHNGWLVEAGSTEALELAIEKLLSHPNLIVDAGKAAMETARRRPWKIYGEELARVLLKL
jgi:glycosyltransferase involved in cell wall biosynthesis